MPSSTTSHESALQKGLDSVRDSIVLGDPTKTRDSIQNLISVLNKFAKNPPAESEIEAAAGKNALLSFATLNSFMEQPQLSVLLDGPLLFPTISLLLSQPWSSTPLASVAFALAFNLIRLNSNRLKQVIESKMIPSLCTYVEMLVKNPRNDKPDEVRKRLNLSLAFLYQVGNPQEPYVTNFIEEGGLETVLDQMSKQETWRHTMTFLISFFNQNTPFDAVSIVAHHANFVTLLESMTEKEFNGEEEDSDDETDLEGKEGESEESETKEKRLLLSQIIRNMSLVKGSSSIILPLLPKFASRSLMLADEALNALSNLSATQPVDFRYAFDCSLMGMIFQRAQNLCNAYIEQNKLDYGAPIKDGNMHARKQVLARVLQILKQKECFEVASSLDSAGFIRQVVKDESEPDEEDSEGENDELVFSSEDAQRLVALVMTNLDIFNNNLGYSRVVSTYINLVPTQEAWENYTDDDEEHAIVYDHCVMEPKLRTNNKKLYISKKRPSFDDFIIKDNKQRWSVAIMWRRFSSRTTREEPQIEPFTSIAQGEFGNNAFCSVLSALIKLDSKRISNLIEIPTEAKSIQEWENYAISFNLINPISKQPENVTIDDYVPCYVGGPCAGITSVHPEFFWLPLLEKACAKLVGSYAKLESMPIEECLTMLGGNCVQKIDAGFGTWLKSIDSSYASILSLSDNSSTKHVILIRATTEAASTYKEAVSGENMELEIFDPNNFEKRAGWNLSSMVNRLTPPQLSNITSITQISW